MAISGRPNSFAYCNNAVNYMDKFGYIAGVDDLAIIALFAIIAILFTVAVWMSTPEFREKWMAFGNDVGNDLAWRRNCRWCKISLELDKKPS